MATVLAMRFNSEQAIVVADESTWHLGHIFGYRRTNYGDSLASLFSPEETEHTGCAAIYSGVGFPSFHGDVVCRLKRELKSVSGKDAGNERGANKWLARKLHETFVSCHERTVDDNLRFAFGFGRHSLNSRTYEADGKSYEIGMEPVVAAARSIAAGSAQGNAFDRINSNYGFLLTRDRVNGVQGWYVSPKGRSIAFATPIATLGPGGSVASHLLTDFLQRRDLEKRRQGFALREGIYIAMKIATAIRFSTGKMGGYFQIMLLDGERGVREFVSHEAHLCGEIMRGHEWGFYPRKDAEDLVCALLLDGESDETIEKEMFGRASDSELLRRYLIGFKPTHAPSALAVDPPQEGGDVR